MHRSKALPRTLFSCGVAGLACVGILTTPVAAVTVCTWEDPCVDPLDCVFNYCWCEGDWDVSANWGGFCTGIPDTGSELAYITRSNGTPDNPDDDCDPWSENCNEAFVQINLATKSCHTLEIVTDESTSELYVALWGDEVVSCGAVVIDGTNGPVVVEIGGGTFETF